MTSRFSRFARSGRVRSDDIPASPPPEVLEAIARAHEAYERLEASGRHVHIELTDASGTPLRSLSPRTVLELAAGAALD